MTFAIVIKILHLLDYDETIIIKEDITDGQADYDEDNLEYVDRFSKYDEISDYMKYFTDPKYHFFVQDGVFTGDEIKAD